MKTIKGWRIGFDRPTKIGWPWHGRLQQISDTQITLTSPSGAVVTFDLGDQSHPHAYPVSLAAWRSGLCQRFQIPGIPMPTTTQDELDAGMTWLNYFVQSGIAHLGGNYLPLVDADNKPWRISLEFSGYWPSKLIVWHAPAGVAVKKLEVMIANPGFVAGIVNFFGMGVTSSSTGRRLVYNLFEYGNAAPTLAYELTISGSVTLGTLTASITRLVDSDVSGLAGTQTIPVSFTATWQRTVRHRLYKTPIGYTAWQEVEGAGQESTDGGSYGPASTSFSAGAGYACDSVPYPTPAIPPDDATWHYAWNVNTGSFVSGPEKYYVGYAQESVTIFRSWQCIGYFIGHDDQLIRVEQCFERKTTGTLTRALAEVADTIGHEEKEEFDYARIGARETARVRVVEVKDGVNNSWSVTTAAAPRGLLVNCLAYGHRAIALANATTTLSGPYRLYNFSYACAQVADAALFPAPFYATSAIPPAPKFSVNPVTGEIFTRIADGRPVSWV